eukprot:1146901-Pelagomonas_calceolata.AAC.11
MVSAADAGRPQHISFAHSSSSPYQHIGLAKSPGIICFEKRTRKVLLVFGEGRWFMWKEVSSVGTNRVWEACSLPLNLFWGIQTKECTFLGWEASSVMLPLNHAHASTLGSCKKWSWWQGKATISITRREKQL